MQTTKQDSLSAKLINNSPISLNKIPNIEIEKATKIIPTKENGIERLLASCCDCV